MARHFEENFFRGEINRFNGSGGEILIKREKTERNATRLEVGDKLIGIGITHVIESMGRPAGPDSFRATSLDSPSMPKRALRAFAVSTKDQRESEVALTFEPLSPEDYSDTLRLVSEGRVEIPAETIPNGTIIMSFLDADGEDRAKEKPGTETPMPYTLRSIVGSPAENWALATAGIRHWNVGIGKSDDFWIATFPSDDVGILSTLPPYVRVGSIRFGLSLLDGGKGTRNLIPVPGVGSSGAITHHHFCLSGYATGTGGLSTPFPIGLRTEILFHPTG